MGEFVAKRKQASDSVTVQANTATNVPVVLNQHVHTSFIIKDSDQSKAFKNLVNEYLHPAVLSIARHVDICVGGQVHQFYANSAGELGALAASNSEDYVLGAREIMNINKAPDRGRSMILTPKSETKLLSNTNFLTADKVGDDGTALREASLGRKLGFDFFMAQNQPYVTVGSTIVTGAINNAAGYAIGATTFTVDGLSAAITVGTWLTIAGAQGPYRVVSTTGGATPTAIVVNRGITAAVVDNAVITLYTPGAINNSGGYALGYDGQITVDTFTVAPRIGQPISFGASATGAVYSIIGVSGTTGITLDRGLEAAVADNDAANVGPTGAYNFSFYRNALALVTRPLALPMPGTGARGAVASYNGLSIRVVMTYDGHAQGHLCTVDLLLGMKVLDVNLGAAMYG